MALREEKLLDSYNEVFRILNPDFDMGTKVPFADNSKDETGRIPRESFVSKVLKERQGHASTCVELECLRVINHKKEKAEVVDKLAEEIANYFVTKAFSNFIMQKDHKPNRAKDLLETSFEPLSKCSRFDDVREAFNASEISSIENKSREIYSQSINHFNKELSETFDKSYPLAGVTL